MLTDKTSCNIIAETLCELGVSKAVVSPGSRNAPLILAFDNKIGAERITVVTDERSAAFIAMGMAQASGCAVALICTSGTALLNYAPAVAEAYYQGIPLIVISADRPQQWIDQDDSQTVRQPGALDNFVKHSYDVPDCLMPGDEQLWYANRIANEAFLTAMRGKPGPVHINVQLHAPLTSRGTALSPQRIIEDVVPEPLIDESTIQRLSFSADGANVLIIAGFGSHDVTLRDQSALRTAVLRNRNYWLLSETLSGISPFFKVGIDTLITSLNETEKNALRPDLVITLGGALVSRMVKQYLRDYPPRLGHWAVGLPSDILSDCFKCLSKRIIAEPVRFITDLCRNVGPTTFTSDYQLMWNKVSQRAAARHSLYLQSLPWCDFTAMSMLFSSEGIRDYALQLSNGTPIRYAQLLAPGLKPQYCNRGVSGIDGSTSTAIGYALESDAPTLLISGDMSLSYDLSGLASVKRLLTAGRFRIAVLNNGGGGIFRFVGTTSSLPEDKLSRYFCADPGLDFRSLAHALGICHITASSSEEMHAALPQFFSNDSKPVLLEMRTDPDISASALREYFQRMTMPHRYE